ncbi:MULTISPECIES: DUF1127 domain-containing protein [unclassified Ruegeria]|uniref:DUF1127 domain-containing protein n=1 Tax=unclassified Ruegeria TaxID=2625375 RepID=UPI00148A007D|nr:MULTISPECIES: DUF1127 domain-containing protein [unclassified Ruegeria]NOD61977.1 DUF1127 domain-containing protein [Ruegeria sp. HKCCD6109]NOD74644.1 DUF1127 domain-containing protein [Ruegeria sp. HKCCD4332]NOD88622.1 DUF1127 domain-containing protein [Ruegeria sp. HKCCD4318]NOD92336.1 DUF1127 domain-containing protein [Ruegeria sp. HKCCD4884]NOE12150.1 DUF1127 domain-containing protein [Ruegeria sp. HKCCD4318-2]
MTQIALHTTCSPAKLSLMSRFFRALELNRQRRELAQLDDAALEDIGVTRAEASAEARRLFWDAPDFWKR